MTCEKCVVCTAPASETNRSVGGEDSMGDEINLFFLTDLLPPQFLVHLGARRGDIVRQKEAGGLTKLLESLVKSQAAPSTWVSFCDDCTLIVAARQLRLQIDLCQLQLDGHRKRVLALVEGTWEETTDGAATTDAEGGATTTKGGAATINAEGGAATPNAEGAPTIFDRVRAAVIRSTKASDEKSTRKGEDGDEEGAGHIKAEAESDAEISFDDDLDLEDPPPSQRPKKRGRKPKAERTPRAKRVASSATTPSSSAPKKRCVKRPIKSLLDGTEQSEADADAELADELLEEIGRDEDEGGEGTKKEEVNMIRTHSGRRVTKPDYKKLLGEDSEDEEEALLTVKDERELLEVEYSESEDEDFVTEADQLSDIEESSATSDTEDDEDDDASNDDDGATKDDDDDLPLSARLKKRRKSAPVVPRISCSHPTCRRTFKTEQQRDTHFEKSHGPGSEEKEKVQKSGKKRYPCEHCDELFIRKKILVAHLFSKHGIAPRKRGTYAEKRHVCPLCSQKYRNPAELALHHRRTHTGETPFACPHCESAFITTVSRERHIEKMHWTEPPLKCTYCPKAFFRHHRLTAHIGTHTKQKNYVCEICAQAFSQPTFLKYHQTTHPELNLEAYRCTACDKIFSNPTKEVGAA
ncbi:myoneurin [Folsomia candida]|uniref:Zinc finger and SCAN domain-containing protein 2 n=1 Tax=Folsomia candida TaxID=158441 RepID=A0A226DWP9_FOLCA|nr:myoneurin [Folsomia candida]OXA49683.1 Zinc finger and SCAN domain-containing protein 2 [Folsomia candida]